MLSNTAVVEIRKTLQGGRLHLNWQEMRGVSMEDFKAVKHPRRSYWLRVGHGGTLDCFAEGVLVIGVGRDTRKLREHVLSSSSVVKEYEMVCELGRMTDTLDPTGQVVKEAPWDHVRREDLERVLEEFIGEIVQTPPLFCAKKYKGKRFSDLAREAELSGSPLAISPKACKVTVNSLKLLAFEPPFFSVSASCLPGTFMRSLARDIGAKVGSVGFVKSLQRTGEKGFSGETALRVDDWTIEKITNVLQ